MTQDIGTQYQKDNTIDKTGFKTKARLHQSKYRANVLQVDFKDYGNRLTVEDGLAGKNFYNGFNVLEAVNKRYPGYNKGLYSDMLRSEHIPFNIFVPLDKDKKYCAKIFNKFLGGIIKTVDDIKIEYAPTITTEKKYLADRTSFDAYIEYTSNDGVKGIIGIEVKYTEHEYALKPNSKEEADIKNPNSLYNSVTDKSKLYIDGALEQLKTDLFRQIWRNHILGESILQHDNTFKHFTSLTLFPLGNTHFIDTSKKYIELLKSNNNKFIPVTYEDFISIAKENCPNEEFKSWLEYLIARYIVK